MTNNRSFTVYSAEESPLSRAETRDIRMTSVPTESATSVLYSYIGHGALLSLDQIGVPIAMLALDTGYQSFRIGSQTEDLYSYS